MVQPHSTFTESQFHPKPLSSLRLLSVVYSVFKIKRAAEIFMPHFLAQWLCILAAVPWRMNQGYIKMHQKDGLMKTGGFSVLIFFFGRWRIQVKTRSGNGSQAHWGFLAGWLLVTHITHSIKVAEGKKAHGMLGRKTRCESCGSSVEAD